MKVAVLHGAVPADASPDELDTLVQAEAVSTALARLGHHPVAVPFSLDLTGVREHLLALQPDLVFNLVEAVEGHGRLIHLAPALLETLGIPCTGASTEAIFLTSNKALAKAIMVLGRIPTPPWLSRESLSAGADPARAPYIIKSVWEHASVGLDEDSVILPRDSAHIVGEMASRSKRLGGECYAEIYVEGREFNLTVLNEAGRPSVMPPAEIRFQDFPVGKRKVVGYKAKWEPDSFEYSHTPRTFHLPHDGPLLDRLAELTLSCWRLFGLRGYARVDFRVDAQGAPWVLEVNANPCMAPDSGFIAATTQAGLTYDDVVRRVLEDVPHGKTRARLTGKPHGR